MTPDDAQFFDMVHQIIESEAPVIDASVPEDENRRHEKRNAFFTLQLVAPYDGERLPEQAEFHLAPFVDLSARGFSFVERTKPNCDQVVVLLGKVPFFTFTANIMNVEPLKNQRDMFKIGCKLDQRLSS